MSRDVFNQLMRGDRTDSVPFWEVWFAKFQMLAACNTSPTGPRPRRAGRAILRVAAFAAWVAGAGAGTSPAGGDGAVHLEHRIAELQRMVAQLEQSPLQLPIHIESKQTRRRLQGDVYSIVEQRFDTTAEALTNPVSWCEILPLQLNVKACTQGEIRRETESRLDDTATGNRLLTLYIGRKFYQEPEAAHRLPFDFEVVHAREDFFETALQAERGPLGTRNHLLAVVAVPLEPERTLIHLSYAYKYSRMSQVAMFGYLKTLGRKRVGFTVVGTDSKGRPIHVRGLQGVIERNAMRYHLAVQAYLDTLGTPEPPCFERRIERWFDLTSAYPKQLFEMKRDEYLDHKRRERAEQRRLQQAIDTATRHTVSPTPLPPVTQIQ